MDLLRENYQKMDLDGLICIGGDGTINGMQPLCEFTQCVLAPKTIDNDLGLNYIDEPNTWAAPDENGQSRRILERQRIDLEDMINYATPGYCTPFPRPSPERVPAAAHGTRRRPVAACRQLAV